MHFDNYKLYKLSKSLALCCVFRKKRILCKQVSVFHIMKSQCGNILGSLGTALQGSSRLLAAS